MIHPVGTNLFHEPDQALAVNDISLDKAKPPGPLGIMQDLVEIFKRCAGNEQPVHLLALSDQQLS